MRVLVTGAGYVGSVTAAQLVAAGHEGAVLVASADRAREFLGRRPELPGLDRIIADAWAVHAAAGARS